MKAIYAIISILPEVHQTEFTQYLQKKNRRNDTKNVQLFKYIVAGNTKKLDEKLYVKPNRNAFHALCKRLQDSLIDFVASKSFASETSEELEILKLLLAARIFLEHKEYKIGFKTLKKAETQALKLDFYSILNEIYHTKIQYAHVTPSVALSEVIAASDKNNLLFEQEQKLNRVYATIKEKLKSGSEKPVNQIIIESFAFFNIKIDETLTYKSLFQLMNITATAAKLQSDYHTISPFMLTAYDLIEKKANRADKHLFYHLEILNLMALTHFRNKDFTQSIKFTKMLGTRMQKGYAKRFQEKLTLLQALNQTYTGALEDAIQTLKGFKGNSLQIDLTLVMCLFQKKEYPEAYKIVKSFRHTDVFYTKHAGWIWVLKKAIIEILLLIELDRLDSVLVKLQRFKRHFSKPLKKMGESRVLRFMALVNQYYENPKTVTATSFKEQVENSFEWVGTEREDIFVMSFYAWLKAKMESRETYQVALELVKQ